MKKQYLALTGALATAASLSFAIPFDDSLGTPVKATVGPGGDYTSLAEAAAAFSSVAGGINRPWTLEIQADLTETSASYFGNTFGLEGSLTIKPAPSTAPTVTFTVPAAPPGIYGCIVFGVTNGNVPDPSNDRPSNGKYVIDGSNTIGGTTRDLTFLIPSTHNDPMGRLLRVWGDTENMVIKNLRVINRDNSGNGHCIGIANGVQNTTSIPRDVDGLIIENCYLEAIPAGSSGYGLDVSNTANGTLPAGNASENIIVRNCEIVAKQRGLFFLGASGEFHDNDVRITSGTGNVIYSGIFPFTNNTTTGGLVRIYNNVVKMELIPSTASGQGGIAIYVDSGMNGTELEIFNNIVKDWNFTATTPADMLYRGISVGTASSTATIEHNSLDCPAFVGVNGVTAGRVGGIVVPVGLNAGYTISVRNNIVKAGDPDGNATCLYFGAPLGGTIYSEGNNLVPNGSPYTAKIGATNYVTLADWQAAGYDLPATGSQSVDPASVNPPWDANLHFALKPVGLATVASSSVLTDIDGDARPGTGAYPGADEPPGPAASVADWAIF